MTARAPMPTGDPRPSVAALMADPAVKTPLKRVLSSWSERDPIDAADDADLLAQALGRAADELLGRLDPDGPKGADDANSLD